MWTQADLDAINAAIKTGNLRVRFENQEITYRSLAEMLQIRQAIMASLGIPMVRQHRVIPGSGF